MTSKISLAVAKSLIIQTGTIIADINAVGYQLPNVMLLPGPKIPVVIQLDIVIKLSNIKPSVIAVESYLKKLVPGLQYKADIKTPFKTRNDWYLGLMILKNNLVGLLTTMQPYGNFTNPKAFNSDITAYIIKNIKPYI